MNDQQPDPFDELMRRALANESAKTEPADSLHKIQDRVRTQRKPFSRRRWVLTAGAAAVSTAAAIGAFTVLTDDTNKPGDAGVAGPATTNSSAAPTSQRPSSSSPIPSSATGSPTMTAYQGTRETPTVKAVPVYWLGKTVGNDTGAGMRLYRTFIGIKGRPAEEAVRLMTTQKADDPDYQSLWAGAKVSSVTRSSDGVRVDFKTLPRKKLEPAVADLAVQQLVYTVQGALDDATVPVQVTEQGRLSSSLFGVDFQQPLGRAQASDVQALVWILGPANGAVVSAPVTVTGTAAAFEAQVNWRAMNLKTKATVSSYTMTKEGQKFSSFTFTPKLTAGTWLIEAYLVSAVDGKTTDTDSKLIFVK
ncbi:MAG: hypothetical protein QOH50_3735 [Kribbellaceae bacterium]|nr:hypothetical protein [Kribbellaceae bacterium]